MSQEKEGGSLSQGEKQPHNLDSDPVVLRHPQPLNNGKIMDAARKINLLEHKRRSEPILQTNGSDSQGKKCFERRRLYTASKQESFDLPEELKCPTEDSVFADTERSRFGPTIRKAVPQRSFSVPATLPDVVPEQKANSGHCSPDVVTNSENPETGHLTSKPVPRRHSSEEIELILEDQEKKQNFEGAVFYEPLSLPQELKRKKSVTFENVVQLLRIVSPHGRQARSHFRSSGYGSQSDHSQASQGSNVSSEHGSIFSDDVPEKVLSPDSHQSTTYIDGNIEEEDNRVETLKETASLKDETHQENCHSVPSPGRTSCPTSGSSSEDETDRWSRQMCPKFHFSVTDNDIPNLSIIKENYPDIHIGNPCLTHKKVETKTETESQRNKSHYSQSANCPVEFGLDRTAIEGETSGTKVSPTTKEKCQRELYERLFDERMLKFDHTKENIIDLFDWVAKNIGEALMPSPRSPFFPSGGSPTAEEIKMRAELLAQFAASTTPPLQKTGASCNPDKVNEQLSNTAMKNPNLLPKNTHGNYFAPTQLAPVQASRQFPNAGGFPTRIHNGQPAGVGVWSQAINAHQHQLAQFESRYQGLPHSTVPFIPRPSSPQRVDPSAVYQQDLPAVLDEVMSSICGYSSELSTGVGPSYVEQLINISQCSYSRCTEEICTEVKKSLQSLQDSLKRGPGNLSEDNLYMLRLLNQHFNTCELPNCHVPWCRYIFHRSESNQEKTMQELMTLFSCPMLTLLPQRSAIHFNTFLKLDSSLPGDTMPREWKDWLMLSPLSKTYTVARVTPLIPIWPHRDWVIKMTYRHEEGNQLEVYKKLRDLRHLHIISHIWVAASNLSNTLIVCTEFLSGVSVRDLLDQQFCLPATQARQYLMQILSAVLRLHQLHIVFLNWTCCNLLVDDSLRTVRLTNFISSVELSSGTVNTGDIKLSLPVDIVPVELLVQGGELTLNSDSWGLACIIHEMLIGTRPWYHLRHCSQEEASPQILREVPPRLTNELPPCAQLMISLCLQRSPENRLSARDMMDRLQAHWQT